MTGIRDKFAFIFQINILLVYIFEGSSSPVISDEIVRTTISLALNNVLFVPKFSISLLSVSQIPNIISVL